MQVHYEDWKMCCKVLKNEIQNPGKYVWGNDGILIARVYKQLRKVQRRRFHEYALAKKNSLNRRLDGDDWRLGMTWLARIVKDPLAVEFVRRRNVYKRIRTSMKEIIPREPKPDQMLDRLYISENDRDAELCICIETLRYINAEPSAVADHDAMLHLTRTLYNKYNQKDRPVDPDEVSTEYSQYALDRLLVHVVDNPYSVPDPAQYKTLAKKAFKVLHQHFSESKYDADIIAPERDESLVDALEGESMVDLPQAPDLPEQDPAKPGIIKSIFRWFRG